MLLFLETSNLKIRFFVLEIPHDDDHRPITICTWMRRSKSQSEANIDQGLYWDMIRGE